MSRVFRKFSKNKVKKKNKMRKKRKLKKKKESIFDKESEIYIKHICFLLYFYVFLNEKINKFL